MTKVSTPQTKGQAQAEPKKDAKPAAKKAAPAPEAAPAPASGTWIKNKATPTAKASGKQEAFQAAKPGDPRSGTARTTSAPELAIPTSGVGKLLNDAQPPGTYFKLRQRGSGGQDRGESAEDPALAAAVAEAAKLLAGVAGVDGVAAGENDAHQDVVVIQAGKGFTQTSLARIPERVGRFATLLALPYELLPLRK